MPLGTDSKGGKIGTNGMGSIGFKKTDDMSTIEHPRALGQ